MVSRDGKVVSGMSYWVFDRVVGFGCCMIDVDRLVGPALQKNGRRYECIEILILSLPAVNRSTSQEQSGSRQMSLGEGGSLFSPTHSRRGPSRPW